MLAVLASVVGATPAGAAEGIVLTTPYPAVAVAPGDQVSLEVTIDTSTGGRVDLSVTGTPPEWTATLRGGGFAVDSVETTRSAAAKVTLDVSVPESATAGSHRLTVSGRQGAAVTNLPIDIRIEPAVAGSIALTTDVPQLKGASDASFPFTLTLSNDTPDEQPFSVVATGPVGWTVTAQVGSQAQAASVVIDAGSTSTVTVNAKAAPDTPPGVYPIAVEATGGSHQTSAELAVEITGSYALALSTSDGVLNTTANAGQPTEMTMVLTNTGTAPIEGVTLAATAPSGWTVTFDPPTVDVQPNVPAQSVATITPSGDAIAGDYNTTVRATAPVADASSQIRVTVETSLLWGLVGVALIAIVLVGLWWTFRRFGRR
jgi:uncharacterized membrane protein